MTGIECTEILTGKNAQKTLPSPLGEPMHQSAFCQSSCQWIYYYINNKLTRKEKKTNHTSVQCPTNLSRCKENQCPNALVWKSIPWNGIAFTKLASRSKDPAIHSNATIFFASPFCDFILTFKTMQQSTPKQTYD